MLIRTITPQLCQIDFFRHVNHLAIPTWFELAREPLYRIFSPEMNFDDLTVIMVHFGVDFMRQMYLGHDVEIRTVISKIGNSSFEVEQEAWQKDQCCARGHVVLVHFDFKVQKSMPLPDDIRRQLTEHLVQT
ncbi:MAG: acyl-CoA thioesterase [Planctomycetaceae bacterium]|nr:acyl-CoA thioesterase [Planctomycetaceae bacterium]